MLYLKKIIVKILLLLIKFLIGLKVYLVKGVNFIFLNCLNAVKFVFKPIILWGYGLYMIPRGYLKRFFKKKEAGISGYFTHSYIIHITLVIIALFALVTNVKAAKISEKTEEKSIIFNIVEKTEDFGSESDEVIVVSGIQKEIAVKNYLGSQFGLKSISRPEGDNLVNQLENVSSIIQEGGAIIKPYISETSESVYPERRSETINYLVQSGDTISGIADKFNISINTILWENGLTARSYIKPGQKVSILPITGVSHEIGKGENLSTIAKKYKVEADKILEYNRLSDASELKVGQNLIIPGGKKQYTAPVRRYASSSSSRINKILKPSYTAGSGSMAWPSVCKRITQYYHWRHHGLDIACPHGTNVIAVESGKVILSGWSKGYGKNVVIDHGDGKKTRYAHFTKILVSQGESVVKGQVIGLEGSTGWSTGPHLHFEVIVNGVKKNPLNYIR